MPLYVNTVEDMRSYLGRIRLRRGFNRLQLSKMAGIGKGAASFVESGSSAPNLKTVIAMLDALGYRLAITPKEVLNDK